MQWREDAGLRWLTADLGGATAAFTTRLGGVSDAPFDSLNLGLLTDDAPEAVAENRRRVGKTLGFGPDQFAFGRQVHGGELAGATRPTARRFWPQGNREAGRGETPPEVDGQVVTAPGLAALVFTADCLPVALRGPGGVAILHCGWRGLAAGIVTRGAAAVGATAAAIGPGIGPCCYEVGEEVIGAFSELGEGIAVSAPDQGDGGVGIASRQRLDLPEVARRLLRRAGVEEVESAGLCTRCEEELFFSHRRDAGRTGRQAGIAWLHDEEV